MTRKDRRRNMALAIIVASNARYVTFQMAKVLVSRPLFYEILAKVHCLKPIVIKQIPYGENYIS